MIGLLKGTLQTTYLDLHTVILMVGSVGYELLCPTNVLGLATKKPITLYTHLQWKDDGPVLYGFVSLDERNLFRILLKIAGVGGKTALAILSQFSPDQLLEVIVAKAINTLTQVPGIGQKSAQRVLLELENHQKTIGTMCRGGDIKAAPISDHDRSVYESAREALAGLGFKESEIYNLLKNIDLSDHNLEQVIQMALKNA